MSRSLCAILRRDGNNTSHRKPWRPCSLAYASGCQIRSFREVVARRVSEGARRASHDCRRIAHSYSGLLFRPELLRGEQFRIDGERADEAVNRVGVLNMPLRSRPDFALAALGMQFPDARGGKGEMPLV